MVKVAFTVRIDSELNSLLEERAKELGISKTSLVERIISEYFGDKTHEEAPTPPVLEQRLHELEVRLDVVSRRISEIENKLTSVLKDIEKMKEKTPTQEQPSEYRSGYYGGKRTKPTIRDVIRSRKVQLLSELTLRNPDSFIEKAKREGVVVIEGTKDVAFVDPEYWKEFEERMDRIPREPRDPVERKLITFLSSNGIVFWENGWRYVP